MRGAWLSSHVKKCKHVYTYIYMLLYLRLGFLFVWLCFVGRFSWPCPFTWGLWGLGSVVAASLAPETLFHADILFSPREGIGLCVSPLITVYEQEGNILFIKCFVFGCEWFVMHTRLCCRFLWFFWSLWRGWCNLLAAMLMGLRTPCCRCRRSGCITGFLFTLLVGTVLAVRTPRGAG